MTYIVHALVISRLDYCNIVLYGLPKKSIKELQSVQNAAARLITRCPKNANITPVLKDLHWLPIQYRLEYKLMCLTFKALHGDAPAYIKDLLQVYKPCRQLRSSDDNLLSVPRVNLQFGERAFSVAAPKFWNKLPNNVRSSQTLGCFKKQLKTYLFTQAY